MITEYVYLEWPQAQVPAAANFALGRYFWLFLALVLLTVAYVLISRDRTSGMKLLNEKKPYSGKAEV